MAAPSKLSRTFLHDDAAALTHLEAVLWPNGPTCPHCGATDRIYALQGKAHRIGVKKCGHCRKQFTVKVGTVFESSHVPLHKWLQAVYLLLLQEGHQLAPAPPHPRGHLQDGLVHDATASARRCATARWPRSAARQIVEADETYIGRKEGWKRAWRWSAQDEGAVSVERGGKARSSASDAVTCDVTPIVRNVARESRLMTDEAKVYVPVGREMAGHGRSTTAPRSGPATSHTNTLEGHFSVFKRGMKGVYQHCGEKHLHRYLAEFDFRYNNRAALGVDNTARALSRLLRAWLASA